jgi:hypothetical protein
MGWHPAGTGKDSSFRKLPEGSKMGIRLTGVGFRILMGGIILIIISVVFAYLRTWNKTELEFRIHLNRDLVQISTYGEPPTFAIWLENSIGELENIYVTRRAWEGDWEGKPEVPVALPYWFHLKESGRFSGDQGFLELNAVSGATPKDEDFNIRVEVPPDSTFKCWIEMNLSGDYNEFYKETDPVKKTVDEYGNGQPALIYLGEITSILGRTLKPEIIGMTILADSTEQIIHPVKGISTADEVFSSIQVEVVRPKPYLIRPGNGLRMSEATR